MTYEERLARLRGEMRQVFRGSPPAAPKPEEQKEEALGVEAPKVEQPKPQVKMDQPPPAETYEQRIRRTRRQLDAQYNREWMATGRKLGSNDPPEPL